MTTPAPSKRRPCGRLCARGEAARKPWDGSRAAKGRHAEMGTALELVCPTRTLGHAGLGKEAGAGARDMHNGWGALPRASAKH
eukprot:363600-Chlamydomonas_euryale.AAC.7